MGVIQSIEAVHQPQLMYNLTVKTAHTFFVSYGQWLVHNCLATPGGREIDSDHVDKIFNDPDRSFNDYELDDIIDNPDNKYYQDDWNSERDVYVRDSDFGDKDYDVVITRRNEDTYIVTAFRMTQRQLRNKTEGGHWTK